MPRRESQSEDVVNEQSPLISPRPVLSSTEGVALAGPVSPISPISPISQLSDPLSDHELAVNEPVAESKSIPYLILLTLAIGGLQIVWSVELSNGTPFLLSLGMSKALIAIVWVAGPVTGVLVQPYIGLKSDQCRISWGRRKPFMIGGTLGTIITSLLLAYSKSIMSIFGGLGEGAKYQGSWKTMTIIFATIMMWCLDFSINVVQAAIRAFICDGAPAHQQEAANAWASRILGVGNVIGYLFGYLDLPQYFSFFGNSQFKVLVTIASISLATTVGSSILFIKERNPQLDPPTKTSSNQGFFAFFKQVFVAVKRLPPQIRKVCEIQFVHWIGWFPFLFYITTYIGQLYVNPDLHPGLTDDEVDKLWEKATRIGTLALLIYAITSFTANIVLPFLVVPSYDRPSEDSTDNIAPTSPIGVSRTSSQLALTRHRSNSLITASMHGPNPKSSFIKRALNILQIPGLTLRRAWLASQLLFALCMFSTFFISSYQAAAAMTAIMGISWSLTLWAPFALISAEISVRDEARRRKERQKKVLPTEEWHAHSDNTGEDGSDQAGIVLGIHNVAVSAPQILSTLICSAVFKGLQKPRDEPGDVSVGWTLRIGGVAALGAAFITWRMEEPGQRREGDDGGRYAQVSGGENA